MRMEIQQLKQAMLERLIYIYILDAWVEAEISSKGNPYYVVHVDYKHRGLSKLQSYRTASFTESGRLITEKLLPGNWYQVTVKNSERGYDEWVGAERIDEVELAATNA